MSLNHQRSSGEPKIDENNAETTSSSKIPAAGVRVSELSTEYAQLALLMGKMEAEVSSFTSNVEKILNAAPAYSSLTKLYEEQAKATSASEHKQQGSLHGKSQGDDDPEDKFILGDEADNTSDPLILV